MLSKSHTKYISNLHQKKFRDETNCFIAEGNKIITELLNEKVLICREVWADRAWIDENKVLLERIEAGPVELFEMEKISALSTPSRVLAVFEKKKPAELIGSKGKFSLLLDGLQDPGNLGTIIRTADWFGIRDILCSPDCADLYNPKTVQSTMGSISRVNILYTEPVAWLKNNTHPPVFGATVEGKDYHELSGQGEGIIIIGSEGRGIRPDLIRICDERICIPGRGHTDSLNAAVATGIILSVLSPQKA